ncbi:MAG: family peptidase [Massilia sp.]|nr:family peptidase [Massilia sp.]
MKRQHILAALASQVWALEPRYLETMSSVLQRWAAGTPATPEVMADVEAAQAARAVRKQAAGSVGNGIAVLPLFGVITQRASMVDEMSGSGGTSTQKFTQAFRDAMADDTIGGIIIDIDSPGGSVFGVADLYDELMVARGVKPVYGYVNSLCASAAYWIGSACTQLIAAQGSQTGSIGVYMQHVDYSGAMEQDGVKAQYVSAGKFKVEGNPYGPLTDEARAFMQTQIDAYYADFTKAVGKGRGVAISQVRDGMGQGRCLLAGEALSACMVDAIDTFDGVVKRMSKAMKATGASAAVEVPGVMAEGAVIDLDEPGMAERIPNAKITKIEEATADPAAAAIAASRLAARNRELAIAAL